MSSTAIATVTKMLEPLPEPMQEQIVEHLREYLLDVEDEAKWDQLFQKTQPQLSAEAERARKEIAQGLAKPLDLNDL